MLTTTVPQAPTSRIVRTDRKTGRFYAITDPVTGDVAQYPSVTTILQAINKPALVSWAAKEERQLVSEASADLYADLAAHPQLPRSMYALALEQRLGKTKAHVKALQKAGDIGTAVHAAVEWTLTLQAGGHVGPAPVLTDEAARRAFTAWQEFAQEIALTPHAMEQVVWSRTHEFAGTLDLIATLDARALLARLTRQGAVDSALAAWLAGRDSVTAVVDFKTGKAIYPTEAFLQSVAYNRAFAEMGHGRVDGGLIVRLPKTTADPGFEIAVVPPARELFPTFLAVRQLWAWTYQQEMAYQRRAKTQVA